MMAIQRRFFPLKGRGIGKRDRQEGEDNERKNIIIIGQGPFL